MNSTLTASMKKTLLTSAVFVIPFSLWLQGDQPQEVQEAQSPQTHAQWMASLQTRLRQDPNQAELWFQVGQGYLDNQDFSAALICFDYAIRLSNEPSANQLAAKATTLYYIKKQLMTEEVKRLLDQALDQDPNNLTALTLIAGDHFISFRYQEAIDIWIRLLDSNHPDLNRVSVIHSLNQAKEMLQNQ